MPLSVVLERREVSRGRWTQEEWEAVDVVVGNEQATETYAATLVHRDDEREQYLWTGLDVTLYRDFCEMYWFNLVSGKPRLFVVCHVHEDEDGREQPRPVLVTLNQEEANGHLETDNPVYSVPIPQPVLEWLERFVMDNYVPETKRKRKRTNWSETPGAETRGEHEKTPRDPSGSVRH
ncbi:MAG: DUF3305 domain-containing protein [Gammaproteobacteria bacterium]|nr:DUF3305 domain-containing protein [Gammaproteobacteria bacterium]